LVGSAAAPADDLYGKSCLPALFWCMDKLIDCCANRFQFGFCFTLRERMAFPGHQTAKAQAGGSTDKLGQFDYSQLGLYAGAIHPRVDLDQHPYFGTCRLSRCANCGHILWVIDSNLYIRMASQTGQPGNLLLADDLVGDQNVADTCIGHHFSFTQLGEGDTDSAGCNGPMSYCRYLDAFDVWSPVYPGTAEVCCQ